MSRPAPGRVLKQSVAHAVSFLDHQESVAQQTSRIADELAIVVGANTVMFQGNLNRDALAVLITAKCKRAKNGARVSEDTVRVVLDAIEALGEFIAERR